MTKQVLISWEQLQLFISKPEEIFVRKWFDEQEDMEPTLEAIDDMDLWDDIQVYIDETENEKNID